MTEKRMTDEEVIQELKSDSRLNKARAQFSFASARIEQAGQQRTPLDPIQMRRMEFEAIGKILAAYADGVYTFDDKQFGLSKNNTKIDVPLAKRPPGLTREAWYNFAGELTRALNNQK